MRLFHPFSQYGWFDKRWILEESLRTPMLIRWPQANKPNQSTSELAGLIDLPQTFLEAANVKAPADMQGRNLLPLLKGTTPPDWRKSFYYHYYEYPQPHHVCPHYGVITDRFKLVHFYKPDVDYWELYDREKDPQEMRNYYLDPTYAETVKTLHKELDRLCKEVKDTAPPPKEAFGGPLGEKKGKKK